MAPQLKEQMESRGLEVVAISDMKVLVKYAKKSQDEHKRLIRESKRGDQDTGVLERFLNRRLGGRQPPKEQMRIFLEVARLCETMEIEEKRNNMSIVYWTLI